jgi:hypothetical protein
VIVPPTPTPSVRISFGEPMRGWRYLITERCAIRGAVRLVCPQSHAQNGRISRRENPQYLRGRPREARFRLMNGTLWSSLPWVSAKSVTFFCQQSAPHFRQLSKNVERFGFQPYLGERRRMADMSLTTVRRRLRSTEGFGEEPEPARKRLRPVAKGAALDTLCAT